MTYYTVCPDCGYKLFKAGDCSNVEKYCQKHKTKLFDKTPHKKTVHCPFMGSEHIAPNKSL